MFTVDLLLKTCQVLGAIGTGLGGLYAIHALLKATSAKYNTWRAERKAYKEEKKAVPTRLAQLCTEMANLTTMVKRIDHETQENGGGSVKDAVRFLVAQENNRWWLHKRPSFKCDRSGLIREVNQAFMTLFRVSDEGDLKGVAWRQYAGDRDEMHSWVQDWAHAAANNSPYMAPLTLIDSERTDRGLWQFKLMPLAEFRGEVLWDATLYPLDAAAREIAQRHGWELR